MCGLRLQSIRIRSVDSFWQPGVDPAVLRMRHEAYSSLRHEKMKALREARRQILMADADGSDRSPSAKSKTFGRDTARSVPVSGAIDIEKVKKKQQKEIEAMMAYEMKMQEIAEEQERRAVRPACCPLPLSVCRTLCGHSVGSFQLGREECVQAVGGGVG
jgi:hypothetical protein